MYSLHYNCEQVLNPLFYMKEMLRKHNSNVLIYICIHYCVIEYKILQDKLQTSQTYGFNSNATVALTCTIYHILYNYTAFSHCTESVP